MHCTLQFKEHLQIHNSLGALIHSYPVCKNMLICRPFRLNVKESICLLERNSYSPLDLCVWDFCVWSSHFRDGEVGRLRERELRLFHFGRGVGKGELLGDRQKTFLQDLQVPTVGPGEEVSTGCVGPSSPPAFILAWHTLSFPPGWKPHGQGLILGLFKPFWY